MAAALVWAVTACARPAPVRRGPLLVAAAADLSTAFGDMADAWVAMGHPRPTITYGASGVLATQIAEGAPFDAFASADQSFVREAVRSGRCDDDTISLYARGQLAVYARPGARTVRTLADLADPSLTRIAIANPEHAPYGRAAREALTAAGVWEAVRPRLVYSDNVRQALQFVDSGNADAAVVSLSLVLAAAGAHTVVDPRLYRPLDQALVVCAHGPRGVQARAFVRFVVSPAGQGILQRHGFLSPGTAPMVGGAPPGTAP